jgi:hypothetical protein
MIHRKDVMIFAIPLKGSNIAYCVKSIKIAREALMVLVCTEMMCIRMDFRSENAGVAWL